MTIAVTAERGIRTSRSRVARFVRRTVGALGLIRVELSVVLVSPATSRRLNRTYRHKDRATNVLAFPLGTTGARGGWSGEIVLCPALIRTEAPRFDRTPSEHFGRLIQHGVLHLKGYDHERTSDRQRMVRAEARLARRVSPSLSL